MNRRTILNSSSLVAGAITALYGHTANAQTNAPGPLPPAVAQPSAGFVNDYLRHQSDFFNNWDIGGQVRARAEFHSFYGVAGRAGAIDFREHGGIAHNDYLLLREKVHVGYAQDWIGFYVEGRDSSSTGDERDPNPESDLVDVHQAFVRLGGGRPCPVSLKLGRQEMAYGDERLIGISDWVNVPRVFDGAKLRYEHDKFWVDAFATRVVLIDDNSFNMANEYETFSGLYGSTKAAIPATESDIFFLARNVEEKSPFAHAKDSPQAGGASPRDVYTFGVRLKSLPNQLYGFDYNVELMGQFGRYQDAATTLSGQRAKKSLSHEASAAVVGVGYTFTNVAVKPRVGVEYSYGSGDSDPKDKKHETFDNLYPTNHKFYGMMDFVSLQNIHDVRLMTSITPTKKLTFSLEGHLFWLAETDDSFYAVNGTRRATPGATPGSGKGYGINANYDNFVGSEVDLVGTYKICPGATAQAGYGHFFVGDYVDQSLSNPLFGSHDADFVYLQMTLNF